MDKPSPHADPNPARSREPGSRYVPPAFEVISLDCEITSYVPDDRPLF